MSLNKQNSTVLENSATRTPVPAGVEEVAMSFSQEHLANIVTMLTDLYKDPIGATVRETISNALDSTKKADSELPVEVTSPYFDNLVFEVRDHGLGMSKDEITRVYAQYGASTKIDDFDMIGAKGMGAKAPLSYTTEFEVVSVDKDGMETKAVLTRTDEGNFARISEPTFVGVENQGTTVRIPVLERDIPEFSKNVENYENYSIDLPIIIDGEIHNPADKWEYVTTVILDEESGTTGDVYLNGKNLTYPLSRAFRNAYNWSRRKTSLDVTYVLGGWNYGTWTKESKNPYSPLGLGKTSTLAVMLSPGVVDFDTSRDAITNNKRFADLDASVKAQLRENGAEGIQDALVKFYKKQSKSDALADFRIFAGNHAGGNTYKTAEKMVELAKTGSPLILGTRSDQEIPSISSDRGIDSGTLCFTPGTNLKFEHFYTDEGFNPAEFLYETVNTEYEGGFLFSVKRASMSSSRATYEVFKSHMGTIEESYKNPLTANQFYSHFMPRILRGDKGGDASDVETFFRSVYGNENKVAIAVVGVELEKLANFRRFNPYLSELVSAEDSPRVMFTTDKEISDESKLFASAGGCEVRIKDFADFLADGERFLKLTKKNKKAESEVVRVSNYDLKYGIEGLDISCRYLPTTHSDYRGKSELKDAFTKDCDYVILLPYNRGYGLRAHVEEVLRYMLNQKVITGESAKIRVVEGNLRAKDVATLESYGVNNVYAHPELLDKASKKLSDFVEGKVGADKSLKSVAENMSENMVLASIYRGVAPTLGMRNIRHLLNNAGFDTSLMGMGYLDDTKVDLHRKDSLKLLALVQDENFEKTSKINNALAVSKVLKDLYCPYDYLHSAYNSNHGLLKAFVSSLANMNDSDLNEVLSDPVAKTLIDQLGDKLTEVVKRV